MGPALSIDKISALRLATQDSRLAIVLLLALSEDGMTFGMLGHELNSKSNNLSYHIHKLVKAGIIGKRRSSKTTSAIKGDKASVGAEEGKPISTIGPLAYHLTQRGRAFLAEMRLDNPQSSRKLLDEIENKSRSLL